MVVESGKKTGRKPIMDKQIGRLIRAITLTLLTVIVAVDVGQGEQLGCGESPTRDSTTNRIIGGRRAKPGEFPFQVRLVISRNGKISGCGGVIIDDYHVLTAAHCLTDCLRGHVAPDDIKLFLGDHSRSDRNDGQIMIYAERLTIHEGFDDCRGIEAMNDIALIETERISMKLTPEGAGSINRICMPTRDSRETEGERLLVTGWGATSNGWDRNFPDILQVGRVSVVSQCRLGRGKICAAGDGAGSCYGDSGGPLFRRRRDNTYQLVGIVSYGPKHCAESPSVFTRVADYIDWISVNRRRISCR